MIAFTQEAAQAVAWYPLHGHEHRAFVAVEFVRLADVGMLDRAGDGRLVDEHARVLHVVCQLRADDLDRHHAAEPTSAVRLGGPNMGHPAARQLGDQRVAADARSRTQAVQGICVSAGGVGTAAHWRSSIALLARGPSETSHGAFHLAETNLRLAARVLLA